MLGESAGIATEPSGPAVYERIAADMAERGWCLIDDFVPGLLISELAAEAHREWEAGSFRHAGVGRGAGLEVRPEIRSDRVQWLDAGRCSGAQGLYFQALEELRLAINRALYLGLFEFEGHLALYPPGSYYKKHLDQFQGVGLRTVTCILYLNEQWAAEDGGQLRIYTDPHDPVHFEEVSPLGGRLVTFLSARFLHEVMPARRERLSITGWFKQRPGA